jgi:hypothetical protein
MNEKFRQEGESPTCLKGQFESSPRRGTPPTESTYSTFFSMDSKSDWIYSGGQWGEGIYTQKTKRVFHKGEPEDTLILDIPMWGQGISGGEIVVWLQRC